MFGIEYLCEVEPFFKGSVENMDQGPRIRPIHR
jgi:hypothetical protein